MIDDLQNLHLTRGHRSRTGACRFDLGHRHFRRRVRVSDVQVGDRVDLIGNYTGDTFIATTVRFTNDVFTAGGTTTAPRDQTTVGTPADLGVVTIYGTVTQSLAASPQLVIRDTQNNNRTVRLYVVEDFSVRTRSGGYTTADRLKEGDSIVVKAYRDGEGNYIAQTIRQR